MLMTPNSYSLCLPDSPGPDHHLQMESGKSTIYPLSRTASPHLGMLMSAYELTHFRRRPLLGPQQG